MSRKGYFRIWAKERWDDETFLELYWLEGSNIRSEEKGLGVATFTVSLELYGPSQKEFFDNKSFPDFSQLDLTNRWIFIQEVSKISDTREVVNEDTQEVNQVTVDPNDANYQPENNHDQSFIWWGFCGEFQREVQLLSGEGKGTLQCYEVGHWINKQKIKYFEEGCTENGFNPIINGVTVGNKDIGKPYATFDTYGFEKNGRTVSIDPTNTDNFFTVKEAVNHMVMRSIYVDANSFQFYLKPDWSYVDTSVDSTNRWLEQYETIDSFSGQNLTDALTAVLDRITWTYYVDSDDNVRIYFADRSDAKNTIQVTLDNACESFTILNEQQTYDRIELTGDRILFYGAVTTYTPSTENKNIGVFPKWTTAQRDKYVSPKATLTDNLNITKIREKTTVTTGENVPKDEADANMVFTAEEIQNREIAEYKTLRENDKLTYRDFYFGYCYPQNPTLGGECLAIWKTPGAYNFPENNTKAGEEAYSLYPFVSNQLSTSEGVDEAGNITKKPKDLVKNNDDVLKYLNDNDAKTHTQRLLNHQTPPSTEMKYMEDEIKRDFDNGDNLKEPSFYYRTYGYFKEYPNGTFLTPIWKEGTKGGNGWMSSKMTLDYDGVTLDNDEPEVFACPYDAIYQSVDENGNYIDTVKDFGVKRNEWKTEWAGASLYDYYRIRPTWFSIGHWGRMVFSFGSYSAQRITFQYGNPEGKKVLKIDDDSYKMIVARPGYVFGVDEDGLMYNAENVIIRNDTSKMAEAMTFLWDYYSKPRTSVKLVYALANAKGEINKPFGGLQPLGNSTYDQEALVHGTVGRYITSIIRQDGKTYQVNSYVSSVEFDLNSSSPRIIIQTEYPDSPVTTRQKKLMSAWKVTKYKE